MHFFQLPFFLLASYLNAIQIERKALSNIFFANCVYFLLKILENKFIRSLRFIDPPPNCQKKKIYVHTQAAAIPSRTGMENKYCGSAVGAGNKPNVILENKTCNETEPRDC